ncbi:hypothetical protein SFUMM280S_10366 [Streptomyces fumanus]
MVTGPQAQPVVRGVDQVSQLPAEGSEVCRTFLPLVVYTGERDLVPSNGFGPLE